MKAPIDTPEKFEKFKSAWKSNEPVELSYLKFTLTQRCNAKCGMCFFWRKDKYYELPKETVIKTLNEAVDLGTESVLFSGGEATLHPDYLGLIDYTHKLGFEVILLTNGSTLNEKKIDALINAGLNEIDLSIDGTRKTHDKIRGIPGMYNRIIKNIAYIDKLRNKKIYTLPISVSAVVSSENYKVVHKVLLLRKKYKIDFFEFHPIRPYVGQKPNPGLVLSEKQNDYFLKNTLKNINKTAKQVGLSKAELRNATKVFYQKGPFYPCYVPFFHAAIDSDGEVFPCCHAREWRYELNTGLGNINSNSLHEIWRGKKFKNFRREIKTKTHSFCEQCIYTSFNRELHQKLWGEQKD